MDVVKLSGSFIPNWKSVNHSFGTMYLDSESIVSTNTYNLIIYSLIFSTWAVGVPGVVANVIILIIFSKIGVFSSHPINITYFTMAISDLLTCLSTLLWGVLLLPNFDSYGLVPVVSEEIIAPAIAWPCLAFKRTTTWLTAFAALERCICVVFPFKFNTWITRERTLVVISVIYFITISPITLINVVYRYEWKPSKIFPNKSVLGAQVAISPKAVSLYETLYALYGLAYQWIPLAIIAVCTFFLTMHLKKRIKWKKHCLSRGGFSNTSSAPKSSADTDKFSEGSLPSTQIPNRSREGKRSPQGSDIVEAIHEMKNTRLQEERTIQGVILVAVFSLVFSMPSATFLLVLLLDSDYRPGARYFQLSKLFMFLSAFIGMLNACFNIIIYYKLSTKFREAFWTLCCLSTVTEPNTHRSVTVSNV